MKGHTHVVVTGASSGIGRATALAYAARGAAVTLVARRELLLREVAGDVRLAGGEAAICVADVGVRAQAEGAIASAHDAFGPIDVLVNNAGMPGGAPFRELDVERIERVTEVNLLSAVWCTKAALPEMLARGTGTILFVASVAGWIGTPGAGAYAATKHAMVGLADAMRFELAPRGIRVVCVNPGPVRTESFPHRMLRDRFVLEPDAVARAVVRAADRGTPEVTVPSWYWIAPVLRGLAPPLYRGLLRRFAARTSSVSPE